MTADRCVRALLTGALLLALMAGASWTALAQSGPPAQKPVGDRIRERIRTAEDLDAGERALMEANLEVCLRSGLTGSGLEAFFPGDGGGRRLSTATMLQLQAGLRAMAQEGLPADPVLAKVQEALMKGVPEAGLPQVFERVETHVRDATRIVARARADGIQPASDAQRERQLIREMAQQMWRGTTAEEMDGLRAQARERLRTRACTMEDLVAASETATRLREAGVEARRAMRVTGEALRLGYGAQEMRQLQYMMVYRQREGRAMKGLVDDFEHCLVAGMDSIHMYQYMLQHGWMGPGDLQGPGGSHPIDDQGRGRGSPGGVRGGSSDLRGDPGGPGMGYGSGGMGTGGGQGSSPGGPGTGSGLDTGGPKSGR